MALPLQMRLKGHRTFDYIYKNSLKYYGKSMTFRVSKPNPKILLSHKSPKILNNFRVAIAVSKKVSKKAVERNKIKRILQEWLLKHIKNQNNHKPYWLLVNLKSGDLYNDKKRLLGEFQTLMIKSGLLK